MRYRRRKALNDRERQAAVEAAGRLHRHLRIDMAGLLPSSADYQALLALSEAVNRVIRELTGADPEWMQVMPSAEYAVNAPILDDAIFAEPLHSSLAERHGRGGG